MPSRSLLALPALPDGDVLAVRAGAYLPPALAHKLGRPGGWLTQRFAEKRARVAAVNLALCFPNMSAAERHALLKANLAETAKTIFETPFYWQRASADALRTVVHAQPAQQQIDEALSAGNGLIIAAPHLGAWEILGLWLSLEYGISSLYRPQNGGLEAEILVARERFGAKLVPTDAGGVRTLLKALKNNEVIGILPDQDPPRGSGVHAKLFGVTAHTTTLLPKLAKRSGAPVLVVWLQRLTGGYQLHAKVIDNEIYADDLVAATTAMNRAIESCILQCPEQYWWSYQRFRRLPKGWRRY